MSSVQIAFRPIVSEPSRGKIAYRITHNRKSEYVVTDLVILLPKSYSDSRLSLSDIPKNIRSAVQTDLNRINSISGNLESRGIAFNVGDVAEEFRQYLSDYTVCNYMRTLISNLKRRGRLRTSETYTSALNSFMLFRSGADLHLRLIDDEIVESYESFLTCRGLVPNTISFYMRILRAVYNRAVDENAVEQTFPFKRVYTGVDKTVKRALPISVIRSIRKLELGGQPVLAFARDMFMMSFYMRGMSFVDMAYLRKTDLCNDIVCYRRRKTGQLLTIRWTNEMQSIINRYDTAASPFLLPVLHADSSCNRSTYRNIGYNINRALKSIARMVGLNSPLTLYCARHSWASAARTEGIPLSVISEGMGHRSESTTRIYLASLDTSAVDRANNAIIRRLY